MAPQTATIPPLSPTPTTLSLTPTTPGLPNPTTTDLVFTSESDPVYYRAVLVTNAISVVACLLVIVAYIFLRQKHPRLMTRTSLKLSLAMACTDLIYHCANLAGYGQLPDGFVCAFVGGWLFAIGSMLSLFYACAIALNTQLVFVHSRTPRDSKQIYFLIVPPIVAFLICTPTLIAGVYGFDTTFDYCWYETRHIEDQTVLMRMVFTYNLWLSLALLYLMVAATLITWSVFNNRSPLAARPAQIEYNPQNPAHTRSHNTTNANASLAATLARRDMARRALTIRLLGYILVPTVCVISGMVLDILGESKRGVNIPEAVTDIVSALAGLMGTLNAILFGFDPSVLAVVYALRLQRAKRRQYTTPKREGSGPRRKPRLFGGDLEMGEKRTGNITNAGAVDTNGVLVITTVHLDSRMDAGSSPSLGREDQRYYGADPQAQAQAQAIDEGYRSSGSTLGYHVDEILETYRGL